MGEKSLVTIERPFLNASIKDRRLNRCKALLKNFKSAAANQMIIFSDETNFDVNAHRNRRNDRFVAFGDIKEEDRVLMTTKHPDSLMALCFAASNRKKMPLIWFPKGFRLKAQSRKGRGLDPSRDRRFKKPCHFSPSET